MNYKEIKSISNESLTEVFLCEDENGKKVVLKKGQINGPVTRESKLLEMLDKRIFPKFIEYKEVDGRALLYREYLQGMTLTQLLSTRHFLSVEKAVEFTLSIADGLYELHSLKPGYAFRDLKPDNILIYIDGTVRFLDLGSCGELGEKGILTGSVGFAAPEQLKDGNAECSRTMDVYGLAALLFYMLVGYSHNTFEEQDKDSVLKAVYLNRRLRTLIINCLSDNPEERCPDILTFKNELLQNCDRGLKRFLKGKGLYSVKRGRFFVKQSIVHIGEE